jgi:hypothetical protein
LTPIYGALTTTNFSSLIFYDSINQVYKTDPTTNHFYSFFVNIRISGSFVSNYQTELSFSLRRIDNVTEITSVQLNRLTAGVYTARTVAVIPTRVFPGGADPYQTDGFKVFMVKTNGSDFILDNVNNQEIVFEVT